MLPFFLAKITLFKFYYDILPDRSYRAVVRVTRHVTDFFGFGKCGAFLLVGKRDIAAEINADDIFSVGETRDVAAGQLKARKIEAPVVIVLKRAHVPDDGKLTAGAEALGLHYSGEHSGVKRLAVFVLELAPQIKGICKINICEKNT